MTQPQISTEPLRDDERFNVVCFYEDESYSYEQRAVTLERAMEAFKNYSVSVASRMGVLTRIVMTDMLDRTCVEWINGKGIVFPPLEKEG